MVRTGEDNVPALALAARMEARPPDPITRREGEAPAEPREGIDLDRIMFLHFR